MMNKNCFSILFFIVLISAFGCSKESNEIKDEWIVIDSIATDPLLAERLNFLISEENNCLMINARLDSILFPIFNMDDFANLDTCNEILPFDFNDKTLIGCSFYVPYWLYRISDIKLTSNRYSKCYNYEISIDTCEYCYFGYEIIYSWRIYPKLNPGYQFKLQFKNI